MTALDAARDVLPAWVVWAPLAAVPLALATSAAIAGGLLAWARRRLAAIPADAHWSERARLARPVRGAARLLVLLVPAASSALAVGGALSRPQRPLAIAAVVVGGAVPALAAAFAIEDRAVRAAPAADRLRSVAAYVLCWFPTLALALPYLAVRAWDDPPGAELAIAAAATAVTGAATLGLRAARALALARPAPARAVRALARAAAPGRPPPLVELRIVGANAVAFPLAGVVGVTSGALAALDDDALAAVFAHELAHLSEPRRTKLARALVSIGPSALLVLVPSLRFAGIAALAAVLAAVVGALWLGVRVGRGAEQRADAGARAAGPDYARALEALYRANLVPAVLRRRGAHPHLYDRLAAAGALPAWPRPAPPPRGTPVVLGCALAATVLLGGIVSARRVAAAAATDSPGLLVAVAIQQEASHVSRLAAWHASHGDGAAAAPLYRAAVLLDPAGPDALLAGAGAQALAGRCAAARVLAAMAQERGADADAVAAVGRALAACQGHPGEAATP